MNGVARVYRRPSRLTCPPFLFPCCVPRVVYPALVQESNTWTLFCLQVWPSHVSMVRRGFQASAPAFDAGVSDVDMHARMPIIFGQRRYILNTLDTQLRERLTELVPGKREELKNIQKTYGNKSLGEVSVEQVRMRNWTTSCRYRSV